MQLSIRYHRCEEHNIECMFELYMNKLNFLILNTSQDVPDRLSSGINK